MDITPFLTFARRLTSPDDLGHAVTPEVRAIAAQLVAGLAEPQARWIYLAGPMAGLPDYNHPAFRAAEFDLRAAGYTPINPARNGLRTTSAWETHMRRDIGMLMTCHGVALLPGWESSRGARIEVALADNLGMRVQPIDLWCGEFLQHAAMKDAKNV